MTVVDLTVAAVVCWPAFALLLGLLLGRALGVCSASQPRSQPGAFELERLPVLASRPARDLVGQ